MIATRKANTAKRRAQLQRLHDTGARPERIRERLLLLAYERGISVSELPKVGRCMTPPLADFGQKHSVSWDWLICGDLKGLLTMARKR